MAMLKSRVLHLPPLNSASTSSLSYPKCLFSPSSSLACVHLQPSSCHLNLPYPHTTTFSSPPSLFATSLSLSIITDETTRIRRTTRALQYDDDDDDDYDDDYDDDDDDCQYIMLNICFVSSIPDRLPLSGPVLLADLDSPLLFSLHLHLHLSHPIQARVYACAACACVAVLG